jgi:ABC-2 type transport system ATP-binding protein
VICTKLLGGRTLVHVYAESSPGPEFDAAEPDLEDVYFSVMAGHHGAGTEAAANGAAS